VIVSAIAVFAAFGQIVIPVLAIMAFGLGACDVVFGNAAQAILPDIVTKPLLHKANGNQQTITTIGQQFVGPPIGSLLFAIAVAMLFGMDAGSRCWRHCPGVGASRSSTHRCARRSRTACAGWPVTGCCATRSPARCQAARRRRDRQPARRPGQRTPSQNHRSLPALLTALATNVVIFVGIGLSPNAIVLGALLATNGFVTTPWNIVTVSLRQRIVPSELLGRVNSVYKMIGWGLIPLGALTGGLAAHLFGLRAPYPIAGVLREIALLAAMPALICAQGD
jgi:hypothetical protein